MNTKTCKNCGIEKPLTDFTPAARGKLGVSRTCKKCRNEIRKEQRKSFARLELNNPTGRPSGCVTGVTFKAEIDSELFLGMTYEVKDKYISMKSSNPNAKGELRISFAYVDVFLKEVQEIKNTYFGIRI